MTAEISKGISKLVFIYYKKSQYCEHSRTFFVNPPVNYVFFFTNNEMNVTNKIVLISKATVAKLWYDRNINRIVIWNRWRKHSEHRYVRRW